MSRSISVGRGLTAARSRRYGRPFVVPQSYYSRLWGVWLLGEVDDNDPLVDLTGNGHNLINNGVVTAAGYPTIASGQYLEIPISFAALMALGGSEGVSIFAIAKVPGAGLYPLVGNYGGAQSAELFADTGAGYNITNSTAMGKTANDTGSYGVWAARMAVFKPTAGGAAFRRRSGSASTWGTAATTHNSTWGTTNLRIGHPYTSSGMAYGHQIAFVSIMLGTSWTQAEGDGFYNGLVSPLGSIPDGNAITL